MERSPATRALGVRHVPRSTYRLQLNCAFTFDDARRLLPYLHALGISDVYASPYLKASPGSMHGYDIVDHNALNPEIGDEQAYDRFVRELHALEMHQLLDIVPNHMGILAGNRWWQDVLENGPGSKYAAFFDIDWRPPRAEMANKVLLPVLGDQFGRVLENGELVLVFEDGGFTVHYHEHRFPVAPATFGLILQPALELAAAALPADDPGLLELQSINTAVSHLPQREETDPELVAERGRESGVIRRRLLALVEGSSKLRHALDRTVEAFNGRPGFAESFDLLAELLDQQAYRLSYWRVAAEEINYRRFFDINGLAALRMERPEVFEATHVLILQLLANGSVDGLRIDHPDGMADPEGYLRQLQRRVAAAKVASAPVPAEAPVEIGADAATGGGDPLPEGGTAPEQQMPLYVVVEKILERDEQLPPSWPVAGTTGYEFLNLVNGVFVDGAGKKPLDALYRAFTRNTTGFREEAYEAKQLIMRSVLVSEVNVLGLQLSRVAAHNRSYRDFTLNALTAALIQVIACFPVYRTYIRPEDTAVSERDRLYIDLAVSRAQRRNPVTDPSIFQFIRSTLMLEGATTPPADIAQRDFVLRFQQVCGPVMAKAVEDTTCYRYNRLVSLNEVGGDPDQFGVSVSAYHRQNQDRLARWPYSLLATSTHDTKRSEEVRARINVLSELPGEWSAAVRRWARLNRRLRTTVRGQSYPDRNDEYLLYQTLVGAWPFELMHDQPDGALAAFRERVTAYIEKAVREAKVRTSWINQNAGYEDAVRAFIEGALTPADGNRFLRDALTFIRKIAAYGMTNSLAQTLLKLMSPGVPDIYQGTELWDLSLVDPDNRRPVDFQARHALLCRLNVHGNRNDIDARERAAALLASRDDGRIKLFIIQRALALRQQRPALFGDEGAYVPLEVIGSRADNVVAFMRRSGSRSGMNSRDAALVVVPRLCARLTKKGEPPLGSVWGDTAVVLRGEEPGTVYRDIFTEAELRVEERSGVSVMPLNALLATLPVAVATLETADGRAVHERTNGHSAVSKHRP